MSQYDNLPEGYHTTKDEAGSMSHWGMHTTAEPLGGPWQEAAVVLPNITTYPDGNPKTQAGAAKPDTSVVPPISVLHLATAMMNGANKYGPFNWRDQSVSARVYVAAASRHLLSYLDGEDYSADTVEAGAPVHHLAHVMACCAILLDADSVGMLNDNRPGVPGKTGSSIENFAKHKHL